MFAQILQVDSRNYPIHQKFVFSTDNRMESDAEMHLGISSAKLFCILTSLYRIGLKLG